MTASARADLFRLLGDEDRLRLLALCAEDELTVGELATLLGESQRPITIDAQPDARVVAFTLAVAGLTTLMFGLAPALRATRSGRSLRIYPASSVTERRSLGRMTLVGGQLAMCVVLVLCAGLLVATAVTLLALARPAHPELWMLVGACFYFAVGAFTAASYAWFVERSTAALAGTSFSLFMAGTNACESASAFALGHLVASAGWTPALLALTLTGLAGLAFLRSPRAESPRIHTEPSA